MPDKAFLTDRRKEILDGATADEMGIADATFRQHRAALKRQSRAALEELTKVAQSEEIDNTEVFDPEALGDLLYRILNDQYHMDATSGGLIVTDASEVDVPDEAITEIPQDLQQYRQRVAGEAQAPLMSVRNPERGRFQ